MSEILKDLIVAVLTTLSALYVARSAIKSALDSGSKWRENLMEVASKYKLNLDDAQRVRASLRIFPHNEVNLKVGSYNWFSNIMIERLDEILDKKDRNTFICKTKDSTLTEKETKLVRLFANFLLKYHFEYWDRLNGLNVYNKRKNKLPNKMVIEAFNHYIKLENDCKCVKYINLDNIESNCCFDKVARVLFNFLMLAFGFFWIILIGIYMWNKIAADSIEYRMKFSNDTNFYINSVVELSYSSLFIIIPVAIVLAIMLLCYFNRVKDKD